MASQNFHESYDRVEKIKSGSDRVFGLTFSVVFALLALVPVFLGHGLRLWALVTSLIFAFIAFIKPLWLRKPNQYWLRFGLLLNRLVSPLILALLFFAAFLPTALLLRLFGKDLLNLKIKHDQKSYWIISPADKSSMTEQF